MVLNFKVAKKVHKGVTYHQTAASDSLLYTARNRAKSLISDEEMIAFSLRRRLRTTNVRVLIQSITILDTSGSLWDGTRTTGGGRVWPVMTRSSVPMRI